MRRVGAFNVILAGFVAISLGIITHALWRGHIQAPADPALATPHRPAQFPAIFDDFHPLAGLDDVSEELHLPPPPLDPEYWPCNDCHAPEDANPQRRPMVDDHEDITLHHDEENRWCLDCHDLRNRNRLRLASGALIRFSESYRLCGQCHGTIYRDWRAGIHGRRTGYWNGPKRYLLCVHCHSPHAPKFQALEPLPPPVRPQYLGLGLVRDSEHRRGAAAGAQPPTSEERVTTHE